MKRIFRMFAREVASLFIVTQLAQGLVFQNYLEGLFIAGIALGVARYLVKPIVNILLLPVNLATLGLFRFLGSSVTLWIVDLAIMQFKVTSFHFGGFASPYLNIPSLTLPEGPISYIAFSLILFLVSSFLG